MNDGRAGTTELPRLGFLGVGWIGADRLDAVVRAGVGVPVAVADADELVAHRVARATGARVVSTAALLGVADEDRVELDGVVIATPSALHAEQAIAALRAGRAVFCQKPLARTRPETEAVLAAARQADRLLGVDLSYRHLRAVEAVRDVVAGGGLGDVFAVDLTFHNAYGPDKPWFTDPTLSGGGCVIDLGTHLLDLADHLLGALPPTRVRAELYRRGRRIDPASGNGTDVEDAAFATLTLDGGATVRMACSWFLHAGMPAQIGLSCFGTTGGVEVRNVDGSFFDFAAWRLQGTERELLARPPDEWGGRAIVDWARRLRVDPRFDPQADHLRELASTIDRVYGRCPT